MPTCLRRPVHATLLLSVAALPKLASAQGHDLGTLILSATRSEREIGTIPGAVQVIGGAEIRDQLALGNDPTALLSRLVPGFSAPNQSLSGASETFRGRGLLVMVDGVPRNTPLRDVSRILSVIDLNSVDRIEVVSGASSLYGPGGTGGTINIVTRSGADAGEGAGPLVTLDTRIKAYTEDAGESLRSELSLGVAQDLGAFDYAATLTASKSGRTFGGNGAELPSDPLLGQGGLDRARTLNGTLTLGYDLGEGRRLEYGFEAVRFRQSPDHFSAYGPDGVTQDPDAPYTGDDITERYSYHRLSYSDDTLGIGALTATLSHADIEKGFSFTPYSSLNSQVYYSGDPSDPIADFNQTTLSTRRTALTVAIDTPLSIGGLDGAALTWGVDWSFDRTRQELTNGAEVIAPMEQTSRAAFAQLTLPLGDRLTLSGGARYERFDLTVDDFTRPDAYVAGAVYPAIDVSGGTFDYDQWTFNAGATFDLTDATQLFAGFSQGYSLTDVGGFTRRAGLNSATEACTAYGVLYNPACGTAPTFALSYDDIAPEPQLVDTYQLGLRHQGGSWTAQATAFYSTSENGVTYDFASNRVQQQREEIWGVELSGSVDLGASTRLDGLLAWREGMYDSDDSGSVDDWLPNNRIATPLRIVAGLGHGFDNGLFLRGEAVYLGGRDRQEAGAGYTTKLEDVTLVNVSAAMPLGRGTLSMGIENLLDRDYLNPTATATRNLPVQGNGRTVTVGYSVSF